MIADLAKRGALEELLSARLGQRALLLRLIKLAPGLPGYRCLLGYCNAEIVRIDFALKIAERPA